MTDPRKPIFDAVQERARKALFDDAGNKLALNNLLDAFDVPRAAVPADALPAGQLSANFTQAEMVLSRTANRRGINNTPDAAAVAALRALAVNVLQPVRDHFGKPVVVTSGYRSPALNRAIGGSATSQHVQGEAADFTVAGVSNLVVARWIVANLPFDQLIYEFGESGWLHVSYRAGRLRKQVLRAEKRNGRTVYLAGLPT